MLRLWKHTPKLIQNQNSFLPSKTKFNIMFMHEFNYNWINNFISAYLKFSYWMVTKLRLDLKLSSSNNLVNFNSIQYYSCNMNIFGRFRTSTILFAQLRLCRQSVGIINDNWDFIYSRCQHNYYDSLRSELVWRGNKNLLMKS